MNNTKRHTFCAAAILTLVAVTQTACATSVTGRAIRAPGPGVSTSQPTRTSTPARAPITARDLLLRDGDRTPVGPATAAPVGDNYFTSARPLECSAAMLFKGSPLRPPGSSDYADSAYSFGGSAMYAESVDIYDKPLDAHAVVWNGFSAVSKCSGEAVGVAPIGESQPLRLSFFAVPADDVLVWTMTNPDWTCDYGLTVVARAALVLSLCDTKPGFPIADWASTRRSQIQTRVA